MPRATDFTLYLSGGWHVTRATNRIEGLPVNPADVDVVFEENVLHDPPPVRVRIANWVIVPLIIIPLRLHLSVLDLANRFGITDTSVIDRLEDAGATVVKTDRNLHRMLASGRELWGALHLAFLLIALFGIGGWLQFLSPAVSILAPPVIESLPPGVQPAAIVAVFVLELILWILLVGVIMGGFFVVGTMEARNYAIVDQIETHVERHPEWTTGCLVVGGAHVSHLEELIEASNVIHVGEA